MDVEEDDDRQDKGKQYCKKALQEQIQAFDRVADRIKGKEEKDQNQQIAVGSEQIFKVYLGKHHLLPPSCS
jgi:hypothetical protein